jgi:hypothetical protein
VGNSNNDFVTYDDVRDAVQERLDQGASINDISLRMIRLDMGDRGSLQTIGKHFKSIKARIEQGEVETDQLTDFDTGALNDIVSQIIERRTFLSRKENEDKLRALTDRVNSLEHDLAMKDEIIQFLEYDLLALEGECGAKDLGVSTLESQVTHLGGMVAALNATIATLVASGLTEADSPPDVAPAETDKPSAVENDHPTGGSAETPSVADNIADEADGSGGDHG